MAVCGSITADVLKNCDNPLVGGTKDRLLLFNHADISSVLKDVSNELIIEDIIQAVGTKAQQIEGYNGSHNHNFSLAKRKYRDVYDHSGKLIILDISPATKKIIDDMAGGRYVALYENNHKGAAGNSAFEVLGIDVGLELTSLTRASDDDDNDGGFVLELKTPESGNGKESRMPATFFKTDYATTKALVDGYLVTAI